MREYWMILLMIFQIFHSLLSKDQTDQNIYRIYRGKTHLLPCLHQIQWLEEKCGTGAAGVIMVKKNFCNPCQSNFTILHQSHCLAVFNLPPEGPCQEGLCHRAQLGDHLHLHFFFLGLLLLYSSRSLICIFSIITYRCGG